MTETSAQVVEVSDRRGGRRARRTGMFHRHAAARRVLAAPPVVPGPGLGEDRTCCQCGRGEGTTRVELARTGEHRWYCARCWEGVGT